MLAASLKVVKTMLDNSNEFSTTFLTFLLFGADDESAARPIVLIFEFGVVKRVRRRGQSLLSGPEDGGYI